MSTIIIPFSIPPKIEIYKNISIEEEQNNFKACTLSPIETIPYEPSHFDKIILNHLINNYPRGNPFYFLNNNNQWNLYLPLRHNYINGKQIIDNKILRIYLATHKGNFTELSYPIIMKNQANLTTKGGKTQTEIVTLDKKLITFFENEQILSEAKTPIENYKSFLSNN